MTHARTRWQRLGRLRGLLGGDDHRLARARYCTRKSAYERARQVRTAARKGQ